MEFKIAKRLQRVEPSPSIVAAQRARELKAQGRDIISLSVGEPDFPTPPHIIEAAAAAAKRGETKYTAIPGTLELRTALTAKLKKGKQALVIEFLNDKFKEGEFDLNLFVQGVTIEKKVETKDEKKEKRDEKKR